MDAPMKKYMRPGIVSFKAFPLEQGTGPILESLSKICEDDFFSAVEVGWIKDPLVRDEARRILEQSHVEVCYGAQPAMFSQKLNINALDPEARRRAVNQMKNCIREAAHLGARWVRVFSGKDPGPQRREEAKKILVDSLLEICEFAQGQNNPGLTLKIFDRAIDKEFLVGPYQDALDVVRAVRQSFPTFGLLVDLSHFSLLEEDPAVVIPALRPYLVHVHIGNAYLRDRRHVAYGDLQPRFGFPDSEVTVDDVRAFFRLLLDQGFFNPVDRPVCSAEVRPLVAGERSELIIAGTKRVMAEAWALA
ncbi:MAG: TIM barrel protein [Armatimonadota bacterium]|nr:TIM barrel protein [Armatimonadota bacterium]MDR7451828.1 TIM barrel protein [Armatimonadota bacterium]MDR7467553.1 TIM barrel protein [Armatimonadota bacterium]MDR7494486.1 TIM barrel protein [Armatimonadota bacterium]MDR7499747.1 TIM barrel protein [Armatimonadota bacterium]